MVEFKLKLNIKDKNNYSKLLLDAQQNMCDFIPFSSLTSTSLFELTGSNSF